ncbi:hypothetical protein ACO0K3_05095 [Undibacterium sp. Rencai35W]|uniref:hypothetical protein n=1 Tax=Undibacterium sp. Rencai35W TaxID=3413046 RepID=UPI003BF1592A
MDNKEEREWAVFGLFANAIGLLPDGSFESRKPDEPDILYWSAAGPSLAFELVEILDRDYSTSIGRHLDTKNACNKYLHSLPAEDRAAFEREFFNADIFLGFKSSLTMRRRKNALPRIFTSLLELQPNTTGPIFTEEREFEDVLNDAQINRGRFRGPLFDASSVTWVGDPTVDTVLPKMTKSYTPAGELNLLAYIAGNPMYPKDVWLPNLDDYLKTLDSSCQFEHIYIFECATNEVHRAWHRDA